LWKLWLLLIMGVIKLNQDLMNLIWLFTLYSLFGWVIESVFKSQSAGKFVNSGFLNGPFCPIYGFGALLVIESAAQAKQVFHLTNLPLQIIISVFLAIVLTSILEYLTGMIMEKLFDSKWWDYSDEKFNLHGRVCLKYSVYWGILAYVMLSLIHPYIHDFATMASSRLSPWLAYMVIAYFAIDLVCSINEAYDLKKHLAIYENQFSIENLFRKHKRLIAAFPQIHVNIMNRQLKEVKASINNKWEQLHSIDEFRLCIDDLLPHDSVQMMRQFRHHRKASCFEHSLNVSYISFVVCRALGMDYRAAARGGLLHDLFLYDWRISKPEDGMHGFIHPRIALNNALEVCALNEIEKDIIIKHMFPLTLLPPRYKESMIVCLVDSYCAIGEIFHSVFPGKSFSDRAIAMINGDGYTIAGGVQQEAC